MKNFFLRFQIILVSVLLLATFVIAMILISEYDRRWDLTPEKLYSLSQTTVDLLNRMNAGKIEILAFYPSGDNQREDFQMFLKACQMKHHQIDYKFYDPDRRPQLARQWRVKELYTVILRYQNRQERVILPNEEIFTNALFRLLNPKQATLCFYAETEKRISENSPESFGIFNEILIDNNYSVKQVTLGQKKIPDACQVIIIPGPQTDWETGELKIISNFFDQGGSVLFLIDPMDAGSGKAFYAFLEKFGVRLGSDVLIDKMSRVLGGDFLAPLVEQYAAEHPVTARFNVPTFFPVARSVSVSSQIPGNLNVVSIASSGSSSWAETNLEDLGRGNAAFDSATDTPGPISLGVVVEEKIGTDLGTGSSQEIDSSGGRMVVMGDSDFLTNAYLELSGNLELGLQMIRWLARDERFVPVKSHGVEFEPLLLTAAKHHIMLISTLAGFPVFFLLIGAIQIFWRSRTS